MVWFWGVFAFGLLIDITYQFLAFLAVNKAYKTAGKDALTQNIINEWITFIAANAATGVIATANYDSWYAA